jgi:ferrous iron transport protein A
LDELANKRSSVLSDLQRGEKGMITGFNTEEIPAKFYSIGIVPGSYIEIYRRIPFSGPVCIIVGNDPGKLAIRRSEAKLILVENKK